MLTTLLVILLFVCVVLLFATTIIAVLAYRNGVKDGIAVAKGEKMEDLPKPETPIFKAKTKEENDLITEGLNNILTYDGVNVDKKEGK